MKDRQQEAPTEAQRLARLHGLELLDTGAEAVLDTFTGLASAVCGLPIALISLVDRDRQWFKSAVGLPQGSETPRAISFCTHAIDQDGLFEVKDARVDPRFADSPLVAGEPHIVHYAGAPLVMPQGERIGVLCVIDHEPGHLWPGQRQQLRQLADGVVRVLLLREQEMLLRQELEVRNADLQLSHERLERALADAEAASRYKGELLARAGQMRPLAAPTEPPSTLQRAGAVGKRAAKQDIASGLQPGSVPAHADGPAARRAQARILLVEDNEVNRLVAQEILAALGYGQIAIAHNGLEALQACERETFDLVLMDCRMPQMDGLTATVELRSRGLRMPVIALTAEAVPGDRENCLQAGMDDYLSKPIEPDLLGRTLDLWLDRKGRPAALPVAPAAPAEPEAELPPAYDASRLEEGFLGNQALFAKARRMFLDSAEAALQEVAGAAQAGNAEAVRAAAHKLKGSASTVGAARLAQRCAQAQDQGSLDPAEPLEWLRAASADLREFAQASQPAQRSALR